MSFRRNIESVLKEWKRKKDHNPIVIKGVRQCGKTFSVKAFAEKNYKHVVYLDFYNRKNEKYTFIKTKSTFSKVQQAHQRCACFFFKGLFYGQTKSIFPPALFLV